MCACTAPSRVLEGATAGQYRPDLGPARRLAAASPVFRTHVIIYDRDLALGGAWAALRARYRARDAKVNIMRQPRCATTQYCTIRDVYIHTVSRGSCGGGHAPRAAAAGAIVIIFTVAGRALYRPCMMPSASVKSESISSVVNAPAISVSCSESNIWAGASRIPCARLA